MLWCFAMTQRRKTKQESLLVLSLVVAVVGHCGDSDGATLEGLALKVNAGREVRARRGVNAQSFFEEFIQAVATKGGEKVPGAASPFRD